MDIYLDADAHRVFPQALHAARRHALELYVVTPDYLAVDGNVHLILVEDRQVNRGAWIAGNILPGDICVTDDPELAAGCIRKGATALTTLGRHWLGDARGDDVRSLSDNLAARGAPDPRFFAKRLEQAIALGRGADMRLFGPPRAFPRSVAATDLARAAMPRAALG